MLSEKLALSEIPLEQFRDVTTVQNDKLSGLRYNIISNGRTRDRLWTNENTEQKQICNNIQLLHYVWFDMRIYGVQKQYRPRPKSEVDIVFCTT